MDMAFQLRMEKNVLRTILASMVALTVVLTACDVFVSKSDADRLKEKEKYTYTLKKDIDIDGKKLGRGERVKIVITGVKEWIKVHAYPAQSDALKAERYLVLYLFAEDFPDGRFSMKFFEEQLNAAVAAGSGAAAPEKNTRRK